MGPIKGTGHKPFVLNPFLYQLEGKTNSSFAILFTDQVFSSAKLTQFQLSPKQWGIFQVTSSVKLKQSQSKQTPPRANCWFSEPIQNLQPGADVIGCHILHGFIIEEIQYLTYICHDHLGIIVLQLGTTSNLSKQS